MNGRNDKYEIRLAKPEDAEQLLRLYECDDFKGNISVLFTRRPDPFVSLMHEGEKVVIPVVTDQENGLIVGMGVCIVRKTYINDEVKNVGYLTGLKGLPEYRKRVPYIFQVYKSLYELTKDEVDIFYTTILKENTEVQKMLEKKRKNMPEYKSLGEYTVYCFKTGTSMKDIGYTLEMGSLCDLETQRNAAAAVFNFSPVDIHLHGLRDEDTYFLRDHHGEIVASCALWNQQSYKQYVVTKYSGIYRYLSKLPLKWLGYPGFPQENVPANYASISLLTVKDNNPLLAEHFVSRVAQKSLNYEFLMLGLFENHPYTGFMDRIKSVKYQSRVYTVHFEDHFLVPDNRPVNLEVGLL